MNRPQRPLRVYLAGPEVFLPDAVAAGRRKQEICARHGLTGIYPLDNALSLDSLPPQEAGLRIAAANESLMRGCDLTIANMTPFRGPSADVGTAFEMGFMRALGRPVLAYSNIALPFAARTRTGLGLAADAMRDTDGMALEDFGLTDNLMLDGAVQAGGRPVLLPDSPIPHADLFTDLSVFARCCAVAAMLNRSDD